MAGDLAVRQLDGERGEVLAVLASSRIAGSSMAPRLGPASIVRDGRDAAQRARRRADPVLDRPPDRLLPHGVLREPRRRPWPPRRVLPGDRRVPRVLGRGRQRPVDADAAVRLPGPARRRPVVRLRRPLGRGARGRRRLPGRARGHPPVGARVRRPRRPRAPTPWREPDGHPSTSCGKAPHAVLGRHEMLGSDDPGRIGAWRSGGGAAEEAAARVVAMAPREQPLHAEQEEDAHDQAADHIGEPVHAEVRAAGADGDDQHT